MSRSRLALGGLLALVPGCADDPDDLDPEVVNALTVTAGNALGFQRSGDYAATLTELECSGCVRLFELAPYSACASTNGGGGAMLTVLQTDGVLVIDYGGAAAVGPLDADGSFAVGAVADLSTPLSEGHVVLRVDGAFEPDAVPERFEGELRQRISGHIEDEGAIDCTERYALEATRLF